VAYNIGIKHDIKLDKIVTRGSQICERVTYVLV